MKHQQKGNQWLFLHLTKTSDVYYFLTAEEQPAFCFWKQTQFPLCCTVVLINKRLGGRRTEELCNNKRSDRFLVDEAERQSFYWRQLKHVSLLPPSGQTIHKLQRTIKRITSMHWEVNVKM